MPRIVIIAGSLLLTSTFVTGAVSPLKGWFTETAPALIRSAFAPSSFNIESRMASCVGTLPQVTLSWGTSSGADVYLVERQYPSGGNWEAVGESSTTSFTDATYEAGYDIGAFSYRVQGQGKSGNTYSPSVKISVPDCAPAAPPVPLSATSAPALFSTTNVLNTSVTALTVSQPVSTQTTASVAPSTSTVTPTPTATVSASVTTTSKKSSSRKQTTTTTTTTPTPTTPTPAPTSTPVITVPVTTTTTTPASVPAPTPTPMPVSTPATTATTSTTSTQKPTATSTTTTTTTTTGSTTTTTPTTASLQWGAYVDGDAAGLTSFETLVGKPVKIQAVFVGWGNTDDFPSYLTAPLKAQGKTLLIFWEPSNGDPSIVDQPTYNYDSIINGSWDSSIKKMAADVKAYGAPVIIVPFEEMNGDWYPWSGTKNGNTPAKEIAAWRHMHDLFAGVPNVKWGWAPNSTSWPNTTANDLTAYYPGDAYVDYVGADGFNFNDGSWDSFATIFNGALTKLEAYKKPIYLFSMASAQGTAKAAWITDAFAVQVKKHPSIAGWIWFNTNKEKDWRVNSDAASLTAFKAILP